MVHLIIQRSAQNKKKVSFEKEEEKKQESPQSTSSDEKREDSTTNNKEREKRVVARNSVEAEIMKESRGDNLIISWIDQTPLFLSFSVVHISPITILLSVNVSTEATVCCGAWPLGEEMNMKKLQANTPGVVVSGK